MPGLSCSSPQLIHNSQQPREARVEEHSHHGHSPVVPMAGLLQPTETPGLCWGWGTRRAAGWEGPWVLGEFLLSCGESHVSKVLWDISGRQGVCRGDTGVSSLIHTLVLTCSAVPTCAHCIHLLQGSKHQKTPSGEQGLDEVPLLRL